jgi:hypothetical protein
MYSTHVLSLFSAFMQDRVPAFSPEKAKVFIEKEMGCSIDVVYKEFEERPIAAASLGQVFNPKLCYKKNPKLCMHLHFLPSTIAYLAYHKHIMQSFFSKIFPCLNPVETRCIVI